VWELGATHTFLAGNADAAKIWSRPGGGMDDFIETAGVIPQ
jgi:hypothetical protein